MARKPIDRRPAPPPPAPRVRRAYFECRFGQLHVHNAIPAGGGFDERMPLLCVHEPGATGRAFVPLLPALGRDRSVYAPDLPGCGESDGPPAGGGSVADIAAGLGDFLDAMRLRQIDLLARRAGSAVALELARARPQQIRRIALIGPSASAPAAGSARVLQVPEAGSADGAPAESLLTALREFLV